MAPQSSKGDRISKGGRMKRAQVRQSSAKKKNHADFKIDLDKVPNGNRKPVDLHVFVEHIKSWRDESAHSSVLIS